MSCTLKSINKGILLKDNYFIPKALICNCHSMYTCYWWWFFSLASSGVDFFFFNQRPRGADVCRLCYPKAWESNSRLLTLSGEKTWTYCWFCYFMFNLNTAKFCSRPVPWKSAAKVWNAKAVQAAVGLGADICENILFGHAVGGHDTASSPFSVGKGLPMQKVK